MNRILVTGANGQTGRELRQLTTKLPGSEFIFTGREDLDISDSQAVDRFFAEHEFRYCINCAAYTAVDKAESEPWIAWQWNVAGVEHIAKACARHQTFLIHLSTDYIYHSMQQTPFREDDPVRPQSVYARTKYGGDLAALSLNPASMVLRTSWVYSTFGHNFVRTMLRLGREKPQLRVISDQIGTPTYARDLAVAMLLVIDRLETGMVTPDVASGIFNYSNEGVASWYDFALAIFEIKKITCSVVPIETTEYPTAAMRPPFSVLNKKKFKSVFQTTIPHWRESLKDCLDLIADN